MRIVTVWLGELSDDLAVVLVLLLLAGHVVVGQEEVLGPEQADAGRADLLGGLGVGQVVDVGQQLDLGPVGALGRAGRDWRPGGP